MIKGRAAQMGFSLVFGLIGLYVCWGALVLGVGELSSPGTGFMPMIAGILIVIFAAGSIASDFFQSASGDHQEHLDLTVPGLSVAALILATYLLERIGFITTAFLLVLLMTRVAGRVSWRGSFLSAAVAAAACHFLFEVALGVSLP